MKIIKIHLQLLVYTETTTWHL